MAGGLVGGALGASQAGDADAPNVDGSVPTEAVTRTPIARVVSDVSPSVVEVDVRSADGQETGSGIILTSDGLILTNNHVIARTRYGGQAAVRFSSGRSANVKIVETDAARDLALLRAQGVGGLTPAKLGDSSKARVGMSVVAIGSPEGLQETVTAGIVSALDRRVRVVGSPGLTSVGETVTYRAIQTDAPLNPGNSGGPLFNLAGEVIGVNSAIYSPSASGDRSAYAGLGFAIPINQAKHVIARFDSPASPIR